MSRHFKKLRVLLYISAVLVPLIIAIGIVLGLMGNTTTGFMIFIGGTLIALMAPYDTLRKSDRRIKIPSLAIISGLYLLIKWGANFPEFDSLFQQWRRTNAFLHWQPITATLLFVFAAAYQNIHKVRSYTDQEIINFYSDPKKD